MKDINGDSVRFDPQELADELVEYSETMDNFKKEVNVFKGNKDGIKQDLSSTVAEALKTLARMIATRNWYRPGSKEFNEKIDDWQTRHKSNPLAVVAKNELIDIVDRHGMKWPGWSSKDRIEKLLEQLQVKTMKEWIEGLYCKVLSGSKKEEGEVLGIDKGADNFLRDFGYFDRIPIDIHEKRFILRTGIFHYCSPRGSDPLSKKDLQGALTDFCKKYLSGKVVEGIDLGEAPGIVDSLIWNFCARDQKNICGKNAKCPECPLSAVCLLRARSVSEVPRLSMFTKG